MNDQIFQVINDNSDDAASGLIKDDHYDISVRENLEITPFLWACYKNKCKTAEVLLNLHPEIIRDKDVEGLTCMHYAAYGNATNVIKFLQDKTKLSVDVVDNRDATPLLIAAREKSMEALNLLIKLKADFEKTDMYKNNIWKYANDVETQKKIKQIILYNLVLSNRVDELQKLIHKDVDQIHEEIDGEPLLVLISKQINGYEMTKNIIEDMGKKGYSQEKIAQELNVSNKNKFAPLHMAVQYDNTSLAKLLIKNGAKLESKTVSGSTPLMLAQIKGSEEMMKLFSKYQDNDETGTSTEAQLYKAYNENDLCTITNILKENPREYERLSPDDEHPIIYMAAIDNKPDVIKAIYDAGCDINLSIRILTPVKLAIRFKSKEALEMLIQLGANLTSELLNSCCHFPEGKKMIMKALDDLKGYSGKRRSESAKKPSVPKTEALQTKQEKLPIGISTSSARGSDISKHKKSGKKSAFDEIKVKEDTTNGSGFGPKITETSTRKDGGLSPSKYIEIRDSRSGSQGTLVPSKESSKNEPSEENDTTKGNNYISDGTKPIINRARKSGLAASPISAGSMRVATVSNQSASKRSSSEKKTRERHKEKNDFSEIKPKEATTKIKHYNLFAPLTGVKCSEIENLTALLIRREMNEVNKRIRSNPDVCCQLNSFGLTLLMTCIVFNVNPSKTIIKNSSIGNIDQYGRTPIHIAKEFGNISMLYYIGSTYVDKNKSTPFILFPYYLSLKDIIGFHPDEKDYLGQTILFSAMHVKSEFMEFCLKNCDLNSVDKYGHTAYYYSNDRRKRMLEQYAQKRGIDLSKK